MICPNCKQGEVKEDLTLKGIIFSRKKVYTYFCPICDFENTKEIKISEDEYRSELKKKERTHTMNYRSEKKEDLF